MTAGRIALHPAGPPVLVAVVAPMTARSTARHLMASADRVAGVAS